MKLTKCYFVLIFTVALLIECKGRSPFIPPKPAIPFAVYFHSRHRGICVGTMVARMAVLTAAVCVVSGSTTVPDTRPLTVVMGTNYRHVGRGVRVQVYKIIVPRMSEDIPKRANQLERSVAVLILKRRVPDLLCETPVRALDIDYLATEPPRLQEECYVPGWHFFHHNDIIFPGFKFLLQRDLSVQALNVVKMAEWCQALLLKYQKALALVGFDGRIDENSMICMRDTDQLAQPCHGMYGAPLICGGRAVGLLSAPDAQWRNCTGFTTIMHLFASDYLRPFFECVSGLFEMDIRVKPEDLKLSMYQEYNGEEAHYDYQHEVYSPLNADLSDEYRR